MRIESALFASREGLQSHGQAIAVVGDNVANTETIGYKSSRAEFSELVANGQGSRDTEPLVGGSGSGISSVRRINQLGDLDFTGRNLDVAIEGEGFFVLGDAAGTERYYSRAGNLAIGADGTLLSSDGIPVLGIPAGGAAGTLGALNLLNINTAGAVTTTMALTGNISANSDIGEPPANPATFAEINRTAAYQASATVYDSLGASHDVSLYFFKTAAGQWTAQAYIDGGDVGGTAGVPVKLGANVNLAFGPDGQMTDASKGNAKITAAPAYGNGAAAGNFTIDLSGFTQNANVNVVSSVTQDGKGVGQITTYEIGKNGAVSAVLSNGTRVLAGTIQLVKFPNAEGLDRIGGNTLVATARSGTSDPVNPGEKGAGTLQGGSLERSTSDITSEFTRLVLLQRGYQANSQILNAAAGIIRDTLGLVR